MQKILAKNICEPYCVTLIVQTLEPRTEKEIAFWRKNITFRILLNWWRFSRMVSSSSSAKDSGADKSYTFYILSR